MNMSPLRGLKQLPPMPTPILNNLENLLPVDERRLQQQIDTLAAISEALPPVVTRVLFSEADLRARAFVKDLCQQLELIVREDAVGNMFARWAGKNPALAPLATGSHIDAIPNAGRY